MAQFGLSSRDKHDLLQARYQATVRDGTAHGTFVFFSVIVGGKVLPKVNL